MPQQHRTERYRRASIPNGRNSARALLYAAACLLGPGLAHAATGDLGFVTKWGSQGSALGQFNVPGGIAVDGNGDVYVADRNNHRIQKFTNDGVFITAWGDSGIGNGQFSSPRDVAVDPGGEIYVVDTLNDRVQVFTSTGTYLRQWGVTGLGNGQFKAPRGISIDDSFHVFVSEDGLPNKRIQKFTSTGTYIDQWGTLGSAAGQFLSPRGVSADDAGNVYVMDALSNRIQKFTTTGTFVMSWGTPGSADGQFDFPVGVACAAGQVFVADQNNHRLQVFSPDSTFLESCGSLCQIGNGTGCVDPDGGGQLDLGDGQFNLPFDVTIDAGGNVFVADTQNHRIQKFARLRTSNTGPGTASLSALVVAPNPTRAGASVRFGLNSSDLADGSGYHVLARVYDGSGRLVRQLYDGFLPAGEHSLAWEGTGGTGASVPPGVYFVDLQVDGKPARSIKIVRLP